MFGINQRYFSSEKDSAEMEEVNNKNFMIFNLFYLCFCFGPQVSIGNSSFRICGVVPWHGSVRNITLLLLQLHTHTQNHTSSTCQKQLFSSHHSQFTCNILDMSASLNETDSGVLFQSTDLHYHFQYTFHEGESRIST